MVVRPGNLEKTWSERGCCILQHWGPSPLFSRGGSVVNIRKTGQTFFRAGARLAGRQAGQNDRLARRSVRWQNRRPARQSGGNQVDHSRQPTHHSPQREDRRQRAGDFREARAAQHLRARRHDRWVIVCHLLARQAAAMRRAGLDRDKRIRHLLDQLDRGKRQ